MSDLRTELCIEASPELCELLAAELSESCGGVEWRDEGTLLTAPPGQVALLVQIPPETVPEILAVLEACVARARSGGLVERPRIHQRIAYDSEWRDVWKQFFRTARVGRRFVVRPSWDAASNLPGPDDHVLDIDPGRAFGTGLHATTRLVIRACESLAEAGTAVRRFLDLGCGSGILSIAAARLWPAAKGVALDIDPEATACTEENLARNRIGSVTTLTGTVGDLAAIAPDRDGSFDLILANIEPSVLCLHAPDLRRRVAPTGRLVLSGILVDAAPAVQAAYKAVGFTIDVKSEDDGWTALTLGVTADPGTLPAGVRA